MTIETIYDRLVEAVAGDGDTAAVRFVTVLQPTGGSGTRVMPPTYPGGYVKANRMLDSEVRSTVLLDSYQSQANRIEEALLAARDDGRIALPLFEMTVNAAPWTVRLTSLDFPHRYADAYLRDSTIGGVKYDATDIGKALRVVEPSNAAALYQYDPGSLVFGAWNSHRKGRQPKFARAYRSEVIGLDFKDDARRGGRLDPLNLTGSVEVDGNGDWTFSAGGEKKKGSKLSELGHGNALSGDAVLGGVTVSEVRRLGALSFAALARLQLGDRAATLAGRAVLAALAIAGDRLAFGAPGWVFRSGCELTVASEEIAWELRGGATEPFDVSTTDALALFAHAVERSRAAGLELSTETVVIEPIPALRTAIEHALVAAETAETS